MTSIEKIDLADIYGNAELSVDPDRFAGRKASVAAVAKGANTRTLLDLARIAFELHGGGATEAIVNAIRKSDPSFSAKTHARELRILAVGALETLTTGNLVNAAGIHAVLTLSACGQRSCDVDGHLVTRMEGRRRSSAVILSNNSPRTDIKVDEFRFHDFDEELTAAVAVAPQGGEKLRENFEAIFGTFEISINNHEKSLVKEVQLRLEGVNRKIRDQQNEIDLLWWLIGGWSNQANAPLVSFDPAARALLVGIDLGWLSDQKGGPTAVTTLVERALGQIPKAKKDSSLQQIIGGLELDDIGKLGLAELDLSDVEAFPVLGVLKRRLDRGAEASEDSLYVSIEALRAKMKQSVHEWAEHVYHEVVLARKLHDDD